MADELVLVLQPTPSAITAAYAGIKRLHYAHALKQARLIFNGVNDAESAQLMLTNLVNTGSRHLAVSLQDGGLVRADLHLADARRLRQSVVEAFATSPAAVDFRRIADELWRSPWRSKVLRSRAAERGHRIVDGAIDAAHAASHPAAAFQGSSF
jgi:flagellar biosynthesis protein FlhG